MQVHWYPLRKHMAVMGVRGAWSLYLHPFNRILRNRLTWCVRLVYMVGLQLNNSWLEGLNSCNHKKKLIGSCLGAPLTPFFIFKLTWFIDVQILITCSACNYLIFVSFHVLICHESALGSANWSWLDDSGSDSSLTAKPNAR
jgi:hypothetical protein